ncbi:hypothetical protein Lgra_1417 [Legionella gratiana]|uniref:Uncharacterized protein n=1 Tax=Legionella gratiana TaxID=45066 RepID=A0A378JHU0_9GAMM|nr:hypothetical protein Lgra_1417 [Legionella gratiana]STX46437.1 Uncharacterised protein [Legionella gratiana]
MANPLNIYFCGTDEPATNGFDKNTVRYTFLKKLTSKLEGNLREKILSTLESLSLEYDSKNPMKLFLNLFEILAKVKEVPLKTYVKIQIIYSQSQYIN